VADWVRRAGHGRTDDGRSVTWSIAEGRRGRRWREVVVAGEGIASSLLLELDTLRRFSHLELSTPAGLLTLHPEGDGTLHGNVVRAGGIEHVRGLAWSPETVVLLEGSPVCAAIASSAAGSATGGPLIALRIGLDLSLRRLPVEIDLPATTEGLPELREAASWRLEEVG
jgi:hypothetical protein